MQILAWLCLGNILYIGWVAMRQHNLNLLIAIRAWRTWVLFSSASRSLNLIGVTGAVVIMIAHGFLAALTFGLSGYIYQQTGTLEMKELGGLLRKLPFIGTALLMARTGRLRFAGVRKFRRRSHGVLRCVEGVSARDRPGALGRIDDRCALTCCAPCETFCTSPLREKCRIFPTQRTLADCLTRCCSQPLVFGCFRGC